MSNLLKSVSRRSTLLESSTKARKLKSPRLVGVPLIRPLEGPLELRFRPGGRAPSSSNQVYGGRPPAAARVCEYAVPNVPVGNGDVVVMLRVRVILRRKILVAVPSTPSTTRTVKLKSPPGKLGVKLITPVLELISSPGGIRSLGALSRTQK